MEKLSSAAICSSVDLLNEKVKEGCSDDIIIRAIEKISSAFVQDVKDYDFNNRIDGIDSDFYSPASGFFHNNVDYNTALHTAKEIKAVCSIWKFNVYEYLELFIAVRCNKFFHFEESYHTSKIIKFKPLSAFLQFSGGDKKIFMSLIRQYINLPVSTLDTVKCVSCNSLEAGVFSAEKSTVVSNEMDNFLTKSFLSHYDVDIHLQLWVNIFLSDKKINSYVLDVSINNSVIKTAEILGVFKQGYEHIVC